MLRRLRAIRDRSRGDRGFTLLELVVTISVIGVLSPVLVGVFTVALRNAPKVESATDDARTLQGVVTWLPQDVDSTPPTGFSTDPALASGCTQSAGTNLLRMEWSENIGAGPVRYVADYRYALVNSTYVIQRVTCSGTGAGPLGNTSVIGASAPLPPLPPGWTAGQLPVRVTITYDSGDVSIVTFEVQTLTGKIVRVDSAPKNPANTLPPTTAQGIPTTVATTTTSTTTTTTTIPVGTTTTVSGTTTTSTTSTTTTTLPPCVVVTATLNPTSVKNTDPNGNGKSAVNVGVLASPVTLTATTSGVCIGLEARGQTGAPNGELFHNFTSTGTNTWSVTFPGYPQGSSELWADGSRNIIIDDARGGPYMTVTLDVK